MKTRFAASCYVIGTLPITATEGVTAVESKLVVQKDD